MTSIKELTNFDMAKQLRTDEDIATYLSMVLEDGDTDELIHALGHIAKARGMTQIAKDSGLGRESLYKALRSGSRPQFDTIVKVLKSLNFDLKAVIHTQK
ncbi:addiction module antidote protein [Marinomonas spartinae]|uniref:addiction module antidote protein n=1 Tax=Marinomonas spartinae TaxID=1792290 RepID=UPI0018F221EF|nr:addiction module antidote protein [Marinomonas spartinae]MBJ7556646.1 putative addiction module antidote protein [Marinomonas spartinae]